MAVALEQEMKAKAQEARAKVIEAEAEVPMAMAEAFRNGNLGTRSNSEGYYGQSNPEVYVLNPEEVRETIKELVLEAKKGNPVMDISGLFVSRDGGEANGRGLGMDFREAIRGTKKSKKKMSLSEMHFGYPETDHGYFRRFQIKYSIPADEMKVSK